MPIEEIKPIIKSENQTPYTNTVHPAKTSPYPNDSVELSNKKTNQTTKTKLKKFALLTGGALAALSGGIILFARHQGNKIAKLYKEKLVLSNLPEKIEFKEAKTIQEGIDFAKKVLGIKEVDKDITLEAINTANKGLVDVSNANKGKLFMPTRLGFQTPNNNNDDFLAYVVKDIESPNFGNLVVNKSYFDEKFLDKEITEFLYTKTGEKYFDIDKTSGTLTTKLKVGCVRPFPSGDLAELAEKFYEDSSKLSINEKQKLFYSFQYGIDNALGVLRSPLEHIKSLFNAKPQLYKDTVKIEEAIKLSNKEQSELLKNMAQKLEESGSYWKFRYNMEYPETTIYHEMGHLQDFARNLKELDVKQWHLNLKQIWKDSWHKSKTGEDVSRTAVEEVDNRWGTVSKDFYEKLFKEKPDKFKKLYPDLYEFLTNQEIQQSAGKISSYAQSGIGEFIADTYKNIIAGKKIPDDVMELYKRYKGPELPT